jgi:hypothetical protein
MKSLKKLMMNLSPEVVLAIRGRHAVGKSEAVAQFAAEIGLPLVMRRLSQMTEGDMLGLPVIDDPRKGTSFTLCEWFLEACDHPVVLFLDERNRALEAVKQSVFEILDSRVLYGRKLHPGTYVVIAENVGDSYQVQACDPAEVSRTVTVELDPSHAEWVAYATGKCHPATVEFVRSEGEKVLEFRGLHGAYEPNKKYPDRRSWFKLDAELNRPRPNLDGKSMFEAGEDIEISVMSCGFLGVETGLKFARFLKDREKNVTAKDILSDWTKTRARLSNNDTVVIANEVYVELTNKIKEHFIVLDANGKAKKVAYSEKNLSNLIAFFKDLPGEPGIALFTALSNNLELFKAMAKPLGLYMAEKISGEQARQEATEASAKK